MKTADVCRKHWISDATLYKWKAKYGGMTASETARLRTLEEENRRLKKLLAERIDPQAYLADVFTRIVNDHPNSRIDDFLPWAYPVQPALSNMA